MIPTFGKKNNTFISGINYDFSKNSFGSSTELGIIQNDRGVQGTGVLWELMKRESNNL